MMENQYYAAHHEGLFDTLEAALRKVGASDEQIEHTRFPACAGKALRHSEREPFAGVDPRVRGEGWA